MAEKTAPPHHEETHVEGPERHTKDREVLICIDGSANADNAFEWYARNTHKLENDVIMFNISDLPRISSYIGMGAAYAFPAEEWQRICQEHYDNVKELQAKCEQNMKHHRMHGKVVCCRSDTPGYAICQYAKDKNINLIIMGSRGLGAFRRTVMGSISDYVLHHAHVPVLIVPPAEKHGHHK